MWYTLLFLFSILWLLPGALTALLVLTLIIINREKITLRDWFYLLLIVLLGPINLLYMFSFFD